MVTLKIKGLSEKEIDRVSEMAWDNLTPFESIEAQFGLKEDDIVKIMKLGLKGNTAVARKNATKQRDAGANRQGPGAGNKQLKK